MIMDMQVKKYLILYYDILGYKQLLKEFRSQDDYLKLIDDGFKLAEQIVNMYKEIKINKIVFSDNVVIAIDFEYCTSEVIFKFLKMACFIQNYLVLQSTFIRGAIVVGDLYFSKDPVYVFGQGLVDAYIIENDQAKYLRIIINDQSIKILNEKQIDKHIFIKDSDEKYFLNYMYIMGILLMDDSVEIDLKYKGIENLHNMKFIIINMINVFKNDEKVKDKYNWVARYYNRFLKMISIDKISGLKELFIDEIAL